MFIRRKKTFKSKGFQHREITRRLAHMTVNWLIPTFLDAGLNGGIKRQIKRAAFIVVEHKFKAHKDTNLVETTTHAYCKLAQPGFLPQCESRTIASSSPTT